MATGKTIIRMIPNLDVMDTDSVDENDDIDEADEEEIDEELMLPEVLANISYSEKLELLQYKRECNEVSIQVITTINKTILICFVQIQWEEEISRRSELLSKKIDLERLKRMSKGSKSGVIEEKKSKASNFVVTVYITMFLLFQHRLINLFSLLLAVESV
jgi:hypothetical protein